MKTGKKEYIKEIHIMIDNIKSLQRIKRIYSYVNRVYEIENEEKEEKS